MFTGIDWQEARNSVNGNAVFESDRLFHCELRTSGQNAMKKKKLIIALVVLVSSAVIVAGWILVSWLKRIAYVDSAIGSVRTLVAAETKFAQAHPDIGYACTLSALPSDELTTELVKNGRRNQYAFEIGGCPAENAKRPATKYQLTARPLVRGMPAFCSDQSGVLKYDESGSIQKCLESGVPW